MLVETFAHLEALLTRHPEHWLPDNLLLLQEYFPTDPAKGIARMEFLGGELLYAMRVFSHGRFNLCPSIAQAFGFYPFERVLDFLVREMKGGPTKVYPFNDLDGGNSAAPCDEFS